MNLLVIGVIILSSTFFSIVSRDKNNAAKEIIAIEMAEQILNVHYSGLRYCLDNPVQCKRNSSLDRGKLSPKYFMAKEFYNYEGDNQVFVCISKGKLHTIPVGEFTTDKVKNNIMRSTRGFISINKLSKDDGCFNFEKDAKFVLTSEIPTLNG